MKQFCDEVFDEFRRPALAQLPAGTIAGVNNLSPKPPRLTSSHSSAAPRIASMPRASFDKS
jgi:hypothetical protein